MPETNFDFSVLETIPDTDAEIEVPEEVLEGPQTEEEQGVASLILDAISNSANTIQMYNAIIANCTDEEIIDSLNEILVDENRIMGKLQSILQKVSPNAEEIMNGAIEDSGLDESLNESSDSRWDNIDIEDWSSEMNSKAYQIERSIKTVLKKYPESKTRIISTAKSCRNILSNLCSNLHLLYNESLKEERKFIKEEAKKITRYSDVLPQKDRDRGWWYFTTHGVGPGTIPKDLNVLEVRDGQNKKGTWGTFVRLDGIVNTSELSYYDLTELAPPNVKNESLKESNDSWEEYYASDLQRRFYFISAPGGKGEITYQYNDGNGYYRCSVWLNRRTHKYRTFNVNTSLKDAKEKVEALINKYSDSVKNESLNESIAIKKNSTWIDTVGNDLCKVVDIKEVEREKRNVLGSFKDTDIIVQYDDSPRKFTFSKGEFLVRFVPFRKSYLESINEDLLYANNIDKEILDGAGDRNIKPITTGTREKCSISAINNLKALLSKGESASLCLGQMKLKDEAPDPNSWISHVWVKSENGDILETNVHNIDFNSREHYCVKEIKFDPKDFENIGYFYNKLESELGGKSVNESLLESARENINQFIRNYLEHHPFDSAEEMIDYLEEYGEIEELEDRFHTDVEAAIEDYFEYLNESLILDESNNLDTSLDDITPVRDEHNERAIRDHKKYKEDRKKAFKEISKNAKDAFELDESLFESFYLSYEDSDLLQDWDQGGLDFSVEIHPYKYEFYTSRDANKALKIAISHGYKDSWREGRYVYLTAH